MKLFLTSSGITNNILANALSLLAGKPLSEINLLFIPTAANTEGEDKSWLINNLVDFQKLNLRSIDILDIAAVTPDVWQERFLKKDVICFGGGNEKYLAEVFDTARMKEFLALMPENIVYMGISAGSMVAGKFMPDTLYPKIFPEEDFGSGKSAAIAMYDFCFIPHLNSDFFIHNRKENLDGLKDAFETDVYATDDETAIAIDGDHLEIVGTGESWVFRKESGGQ